MQKNTRSPDFVLITTLLVLTLASFHARAGLDASLMEGLKARAIGPAAISGRIAAIDVVASNPNHIVVGAATGVGEDLTRNRPCQGESENVKRPDVKQISH